VAAVVTPTNRDDSHPQNRDQRRVKREGLRYRRSAVRSRYVQAAGTMPPDGNWLRGVDNKGPELDWGNNSAVRVVSFGNSPR
jgi:hypothetical protein